jgi:hypothetical protein
MLLDIPNLGEKVGAFEARCARTSTTGAAIAPNPRRDSRTAPRALPWAPLLWLVDQPLIMPAPTVTPVASSMRMKEPVVRFFE